MNCLKRNFCDMVKISSESGNENEFLDFLEELFTGQLQAQVKFDDYGNLIAVIPKYNSSKQTPIMLVAHADTVKPGQGINPVVEDNVIRSEGKTILGADDKAGIAEIVEAIRTAEKRPPVEIIITREEEVGLQGSENLDTTFVQSDIGFVVDVQDLETIVTGGPTHIYFDVEILGKSAHAGMRPEEGISAIRAASKAIASMPEGRIDHETTANIGTIEGGEVRNGVPERVRLEGECRSLDHEKATSQANIMREAFEKQEEEMGVMVNIDVTVRTRAYQILENTPVVQIAKEAISLAGLEPEAKPITAGTDALNLTQKGIESVTIGFGGIGAHSTDEHIPIHNMEVATEIIREILYLSS